MPYIQRVEQHKTDKEVLPKTENRVQNSEKVEVVPYIQREEKHTKQTKVAPQTKTETKKIVKKVIQPIIKDVIQPVHIRIKPVLQEGVKPTIFKGDEVRPVINQGTKTAQTIFKGTKVEKEVNAGVKVRESIVKSSVIPTENKGVVVKKEIISTNIANMSGVGAQAGLGLENVQFSQAINAEGVHKEIVAGTTVRQSIVRSSVLPTIDGGTKVLKTIFGGVRQSTVPAAVGVEFAAGEGAGAGAGLEIRAGASTMGIGATTATTTINETLDLGTTVHPTINYGVVNAGTSVINGGVTSNGEGAEMVGSSGLVMGEAGDANGIMLTTTNTHYGISGESEAMAGASGLAMTTQTSQIEGTQIQNMGSSGLVMGLGGEGDNAVDVGYFSNTNSEAMGGFGATTTETQYGTTGTTTTTTTTKTVNYTTTQQPVISTSNVLTPIVNTTVRDPIIAGSTMKFQTNETTL